MDLTVAS